MTLTAAEWKQKGNDAFKAKNFAESVTYFTKAIEADPNDHVLYSNRSGSYASMNKFEEALNDANKCVRLNSHWAKGWSRKGLAEMYLGKFDDAESSYRRGLELEPQGEIYREGLRNVMERKKQNTGTLDMNKLLKVLSLPQFSKMKEDEKFQQSLEEFVSSGKLDPNTCDKKLMEAVMLAMNVSDDDLNKLQESMHHAEKAQEERRVKEEAERKKREKEAEEAKKSPEERQAEELKAEGTAAYKARDFVKALEKYEAAALLNPKELLLQSNIAAVHMECGRYEEAIAACEGAVERRYEVRAPYETIAKLFVRIGNCYMKLNKYDMAVSAYEKALMEDNQKTTKALLVEAQKLLKK